MDSIQTNHGLILLDKPIGITSTQCVNRLKRAVGRKKIGHAGTLDPFASGLLPVCFGRATKFIERIRKNRKTYCAELVLGESTDTQDCTGQTIETKDVPETLALSDFQKIADSMKGVQMQTPPMYSARKVDGVRLYKLARENKVVERDPREITVYEFTIHSYTPPVVNFSVVCSEGTYVRTLGLDLAKAADTLGYLKNLRRTQIGTFHVNDASTLAELEDPQVDVLSKILPTQVITADLLSVTIQKNAEFRFRNGSRTTSSDYIENLTNLSAQQELNVFSEKGLFLGLAVVVQSEETGEYALKTGRLVDIYSS